MTNNQFSMTNKRMTSGPVGSFQLAVNNFQLAMPQLTD